MRRPTKYRTTETLAGRPAGGPEDLKTWIAQELELSGGLTPESKGDVNALGEGALEVTEAAAEAAGSTDWPTDRCPSIMAPLARKWPTVDLPTSRMPDRTANRLFDRRTTDLTDRGGERAGL